MGHRNLGWHRTSDRRALTAAGPQLRPLNLNARVMVLPRVMVLADVMLITCYAVMGCWTIGT